MPAPAPCLWFTSCRRALPALVAGGLLACGVRPPVDTRGPTALAVPIVRVASGDGAVAPDGGDEAGEAESRLAPPPIAFESPPTPPASPELRLPWSAGDTWYLTSGPHSGKRAALDFAPPNLDPRTGRVYADACSRKRGDAHWVRAAAAGTLTAVLRGGCPCVQIQHDDGTTTNYFHLRRSSVKRLGHKVGDRVRVGQALGHPSCEIGPKKCGATHPPSGVHVHFHRTNATTGARLPADGMVLSGWRVKAVGRQREGVMTRGDEVRQTRGKLVGWACSPTTKVCGGNRNDLESDNALLVDTEAKALLSLDRRSPQAGQR